MRALITGGAGFIGSHLAERLLADGHEVVLFDDLSTGSRDNIAHLLDRPEAEFVRGTVLDRHAVDAVMGRTTTVFHLAAAVGVDLIIDRPLESLQTNIQGSEVVMESAHAHGRPVLVTSSSEIYGKNTSDRLREDEDRILGSPLKSRWSYSEAKAIEEILAYTYWAEEDLPTVIVRLFNTVGPRQTGSYGMVVPRFVDQALRGDPLTVYGDGKQTRCFCDVTDVVRALPALLQAPEAYGQVFNVGSDEEITINELASVVIEEVGSDSTIRHVPYDEAYEDGFEDMRRRVPDSSRIEDLLGWRPSLDLRAIVARVIEDARS